MATRRATRPRGCAEVYDPISDERHEPPGAAGRPVYSGPGRQAERRRSVLRDRRDEEREREAAERREKDERRSDDLKEAWRRNHPSRPERDDGRKKGRA